MNIEPVTKEAVGMHVRFLNQLITKLRQDRRKLVVSYGIDNSVEDTDLEDAIEFLKSEITRLSERIQDIKRNEIALQQQVFHLQDLLKEK